MRLSQTRGQNRQFADLFPLNGTTQVGMIHHPDLGNDFAHQLSVTEKAYHRTLRDHNTHRLGDGTHVGGGNMTAAESQWHVYLCGHGIKVAARGNRFEEWDDMNENTQGEIGVAPLKLNPESETASVEMNKILEQAIESLPEQYRTVVMMRDVEEMTTAETAECLSLTEDNVKIRLHRAHGMLRKELYQSARISEANAFPFHAPRCDRIVTNVFARLATLETPQSREGI